MNKKYVKVKKIEFKIKKNRITIYLDDKEIVWIDVDIDETINTIKEYMNELKEKNKTKKDFFCCNCGEPACTDIKIFSELKRNNLYLDIHTCIGDPIEKQFYVLNINDFNLGIKNLLNNY